MNLITVTTVFPMEAAIIIAHMNSFGLTVIQMKMLDFLLTIFVQTMAITEMIMTFFGPVYDDNLMHQALDNIRGDGITTHIVLCAEIVRILHTH